MTCSLKLSHWGNLRYIQGRREDVVHLRHSLFSLFVDNIPINKDSRWLKALFDKDGQTMDCFLGKERIASRSRFGFIRYRTMEEARAAIRRWNGTMVESKRLVVMLANNEGKPKDWKQNFGRPINSLQ
ncbi:hypothetical protein QQ045_013600 [Rhodiola kirilowii]